MSNHDINAARTYHAMTNHTRQRVSQNRDVLDPSNRPLPYKIYSSLAPLILPTNIPARPTPALAALAAPHVSSSSEQVPNRDDLARLCFFSNGVTNVLKRSGREYAMRAAACTGALFHIELYLVCGSLADLAAGVYHYSAHDHALRQLRAGDFRSVLIEASAAEPSVVHAPVIALFTSTFWRNAYKYRARAYRHTFWDTGTILANALALATALELPARIVLGFVDERVNGLLGIDGEHEATVSLLSLGHTEQFPPEAPPLSPLSLPTVPLSTYEVAHPGIVTLHRESSLSTPQEVAEWRDGPPLSFPHPMLSTPVSLQPSPLQELPTDALETVIRRRGSTRRFTHDPISFTQLSTLLTYSLRGIAADCFDPTGTPLSTLYLIANAVEGLNAGTYVLHDQQYALEQLKAGTFRNAARFLSLGQDLGGDAAVTIYFLVDLDTMLTRFGNRGYRVAQLEAAILAGKMYLTAYALSLGATGLTFFDNDVVDFFSPQSAGKSVLFLIALGHPMKKRSLS